MECVSGGGKAVAAGRRAAAAKSAVKTGNLTREEGARTELESRRRNSAVTAVCHWKSFNPSEVSCFNPSEVSFCEKLTGLSSQPLLSLAGWNWSPGNWSRAVATSSTSPDQIDQIAVQKKGEAEITKAYARVSELERQVEKLEEVLREQKQRHEILELPGSKAENQAKYFSAKHKKVSEKATTAHNQECPDLETAKTQWSPALKQQWQQAMDSFVPHVETLKTKVNEGYEVSRDTIKPHLVKAQESLSPHVQTVKDLCGPYVEKVVAASQPHIEKVIAASQPHIEKVTEILQPYTKPVRHTYGRFLTTATTYLHQIRTAFQEDENRRNHPTRKDEMHT